MTVGSGLFKGLTRAPLCTRTHSASSYGEPSGYSRLIPNNASQTLFYIHICVCNILSRCTIPYPQFRNPECSKNIKEFLITQPVTKPDLKSDQGLPTTHLKLLIIVLIFLPLYEYSHILLQEDYCSTMRCCCRASWGCRVIYNKCIVLPSEF